MKELVETLNQISMGLFINGTFALMQGQITPQNIAIAGITTASMFILNTIKRII